MRSTCFAGKCRNRLELPGRAYNMVALGVLIVLAGVLFGGCQSTENPPEPAVQEAVQAVPETAVVEVSPAEPTQEAQPQEESTPKKVDGESVSLFDGKTLGQWKPTDFGGQGPVEVNDGAIYMEMGSYMTGITWTGPVVRMNYEISLEAMRVQGNDFFCGLTFPVADKPCTLVLGGWGGSVCGLSSIDYFDASENQTTRIMSFEKGKWYHVRLRVVPDRIQAWIDGEELVDFETTDHKLDIRAEVDLSQPLGIATWCTAGAVRNIWLKELPKPIE